MALHIKNPETEALARKLAALKGIGLTEAVHIALRNELAREQAKPALVEIGVKILPRRARPGKTRVGQARREGFAGRAV